MLSRCNLNAKAVTTLLTPCCMSRAHFSAGTSQRIRGFENSCAERENKMLFKWTVGSQIQRKEFSGNTSKWTAHLVSTPHIHDVSVNHCYMTTALSWGVQLKRLWRLSVQGLFVLCLLILLVLVHIVIHHPCKQSVVFIPVWVIVILSGGHISHVFLHLCHSLCHVRLSVSAVRERARKEKSLGNTGWLGYSITWLVLECLFNDLKWANDPHSKHWLSGNDNRFST